MSKTPYPINIATGLRKGNPTDIYRQPTKEESDTVTVGKLFETPESPTKPKNPKKKNTNYNVMRRNINLPDNPRRRRGRRSVAIGSVAKRSATRGSATESATRSVEGGKRTRKYNKKHKKTKKRRGKKRRTMRR